MPEEYPGSERHFEPRPTSAKRSPTLTTAQIAAEYLNREAEANRTPQGADCKAIMQAMAKQYGMTFEAIRAAVLDHTIAGPC